MTHGARARTTVLPREDLAAYNRMVEDWNGDCRPRTPAERALVLEIANAQWKLQRVESAQDERVAAGIGDAGTREEVAVFKKMERLFWDPRGPRPCTPFGPWPMAGRRLRFPGKLMTLIIPTCWSRTWKPPLKVARPFWTNGQYCGAGLENGLPWQPQDRFAAVRMLGKHPVDAALDQRVRLIYSATFALNPLGKKDPYEDLKSDMVTIDYENFVKRIQSRWPQELFTNDFEKAKAMLLDLIARVVERLEGIRDAHLAHAEEVAAKTARRLAIDTTTEGERLARYEMQCHRRFYKCLDAFWKHRREMERAEEGPGPRSGGIRRGAGRGTGACLSTCRATKTKT